MLLTIAIVGSLSIGVDPAKCGLHPAKKWERAIETVKKDHRLRGKPQDASEAIIRLRELDLTGRSALSDIWPPDLPRSEVSFCQRSAGLYKRLRKLDRKNSQALRTIMPVVGWFDEKRYGPEAARAAWFIVQHSPDKAFQNLGLDRMVPKGGESAKERSQYALLYDRIRMGRGEPQRFGSQGQCQDGKVRIYPIEDPDHVDERRAKFGLSTLKDYQTLLGVGGPCG
jgi:hypothetical protein